MQAAVRLEGCQNSHTGISNLAAWFIEISRPEVLRPDTTVPGTWLTASEPRDPFLPPMITMCKCPISQRCLLLLLLVKIKPQLSLSCGPAKLDGDQAD